MCQLILQMPSIFLQETYDKHYIMRWTATFIMIGDGTNSDDIKLSAACCRSQSKSEKPQKLSLTFSFTKKLSPKLLGYLHVHCRVNHFYPTHIVVTIEIH